MDKQTTVTIKGEFVKKPAEAQPVQAGQRRSSAPSASATAGVTTGTANPSPIQTKAFEHLRSAFRKGDFSPETIREMQLAVNKFSIQTPLEVDGVIGPNTAKAFQRFLKTDIATYNEMDATFRDAIEAKLDKKDLRALKNAGAMHNARTDLLELAEKTLDPGLPDGQPMFTAASFANTPKDKITGLQQTLSQAGLYPKSKIDGIGGKLTADAATKAFDENYAAQSLKEKLAKGLGGKSFNKEDIFDIQTSLLAQGYDIGEKGVDGKLGRNTREALRGFVGQNYQAGSLEHEKLMAQYSPKGNTVKAFSQIAGDSEIKVQRHRNLREEGSAPTRKQMQRSGRDTDFEEKSGPETVHDRNGPFQSGGVDIEGINFERHGFGKTQPGLKLGENFHNSAEFNAETPAFTEPQRKMGGTAPAPSVFG
jgi:peptidoglycan hydrolase-like protein with peptidoglycan-binding domain